MKAQRCLVRYQTWLAAAAVFLFLSNLVSYSYLGGWLQVKPYFWVVLLTAVVVPLPFLSHRRVPISLPLICWASIYFLLGILGMFLIDLRPSEFETALSVLVQRIEFLVVLGAGMILFRDSNTILTASRTAAVTVVLGVILNCYELINPNTFSSTDGRPAGLFLNPNVSGAALILGMIIGQSAVSPRFRPMFQIVTGVGVVATFSRGAIISWCIVMFVSAILSFSDRRQISVGRGWLLVLFVIATVLISPAWNTLRESINDQDTLDQATRISLITNQESVSEDPRTELLKEYWGKAKARPILGYGTGASSLGLAFTDSGAHNMYVSLMVDHGLVAVLVLPGLVLAVAAGNVTRAKQMVVPLAVFILIIGFFNHTMLLQWHYALALSLAAATVKQHFGDDEVLGANQSSSLPSVRWGIPRSTPLRS